jgi:putative membrane protein
LPDQQARERIATAIAIVFHVIGLVGVLFIDRNWFAYASAVNLLLMFILLIFTQPQLNKHFIVFMVIALGAGFMIEVIGTGTGWIFGNYAYGPALGYKVSQVPVIIGINWFTIIYCCGISINMMLKNVVEKLAEKTGSPPVKLKAISIVFDGATLAVFF